MLRSDIADQQGLIRVAMVSVHIAGDVYIANVAVLELAIVRNAVTDHLVD